MQRILVVEDEADLRYSIKESLSMAGYEVEAVGSVNEAHAQLEQKTFELVLTDMNLIGENGLTLVRELRGSGFDGAIIVLTAYGTIETAVAAIKEGADDFLEKPVGMDELALLVEKTLRQRRRLKRLGAYQEIERRRIEDEDIVGEHEAWREALSQAERLAGLPVGPPESSASAATSAELPSILLLGETGVGKGVVARHIHLIAVNAAREKKGGAEQAPFVQVNCASLPAALVESALFGHVKGAFTDAREARAGLFEAADGGTIFLDEIGEMPLELQSKLLLVLERGVFRPVGGASEKRVATRVVAATNQDLYERVEEGRFRQDLLYRLSTFVIGIPALRERGADLMLIARQMLDRFSRQYGRQGLAFSDAAIDALKRHRWPGNVRELINCIQRAVMLSHGAQIEPSDLGLAKRTGGPAATAGAIGRVSDLKFDFATGMFDIHEIERTLIIQALEHTGGNISQAAKLIGMNRTSFRYRIERAGLEDYIGGTGKR